MLDCFFFVCFCFLRIYHLIMKLSYQVDFFLIAFFSDFISKYSIFKLSKSSRNIALIFQIELNLAENVRKHSVRVV